MEVTKRQLHLFDVIGWVYIADAAYWFCKFVELVAIIGVKKFVRALFCLLETRIAREQLPKQLDIDRWFLKATVKTGLP